MKLATGSFSGWNEVFDLLVISGGGGVAASSFLQQCGRADV